MIMVSFGKLMNLEIKCCNIFSPDFTSAGGFKLGPQGGMQFDMPAASSNSASGGTAGGFQFSTSDTKDTKSDIKLGEGGGFKFGASLAADGGSSTSNDNKTNSEKASTAEQPSGGFKFGSSLSSPTTNTNTSGGFKFGSSLATPATESQTSTTTSNFSTEGFKFGSTSNREKTSNYTKTDVNKATAQDSAKSNTADGSKPSMGGFSFGSSLAADKPEKVAPVQDNKLASGGISLATPLSNGETSKPITKPQESITAMFALGAPASSSSSTALAADTKTAFQLPASNNTAASTGSSGGFSLGANTESKPAFSIGGADKKEATPAVSNPSGMFGQQPSKDASLGFSFGSTANSGSKCCIKILNLNNLEFGWEFKMYVLVQLFRWQYT